MRRALPTLGLCALVSLPALADTLVRSHHGRLLDGADEPVDGAVQLVFSLYSVPDDLPGQPATPPVWTQACSVQVSDGLYSVGLGDPARGEPLPASLFAEVPELWLGVDIEGSGEAKPRLRLGSVGRAAWASFAQTAGALDCEGCVADGALSAKSPCWTRRRP